MTKPLLFCFEPVANPDARILILGSMPGRESLAANQYYAHKRNAFWNIIADVLSFDRDAAYQVRLEALKTAHIALWDVLQSCTRVGSLDAKIDPDSITVNDFPGFFNAHPQIRAVFFNGSTAESAYKRYVLPSVADTPISYRRLPSTSPAHAALSYAQKLQAWHTALTTANNE
ncbi:MAG: DNA-deoxyinosine glycosylase [Methylobacter sp.]